MLTAVYHLRYLINDLVGYSRLHCGKLKKFFVYKIGGSILQYNSFMFQRSTNIITSITTIILVVVVIIPALHGGG